jgi:translation initiation factor IF-2
MTEQKETTKPTKPLTLTTTARSGAAAAKGGETQVRQKFSHGRTRAVTVEVKKPVKRPPGSAAATPPPAASPEAAPAVPSARTLKLGSAAATPARSTVTAPA